MEILLHRNYQPKGTNGTFMIAGKKVCYSIELPWKKNQKQVSCIPEGTYSVRRRYTTKFGWHIWVNNVPGRDGILIHAFNRAVEESRGCIGPVTSIQDTGVGTNSRLALKKLLSLLTPAFDRKETVYLVIQKDSVKTASIKNRLPVKIVRRLAA